MEFDHVTAWKKLEPHFNILPESVHDLYERVCWTCEEQRQLSGSLRMNWPEGIASKYRTDKPTLREEFAKIPQDILAKASWIIYHYGHWSPKGHSYKGNGGTWKFSQFADQMLESNILKIDDLDLVYKFYEKGQKTPPKGVWFEIHQGLFRLCSSSRDSWSWTELAPATKSFMKQIISDLHNLVPEKDIRNKYLPEYVKEIGATQ